MRRLLTSLTTLALVGGLFLGAPARSLAAVNTIYVGNSNDTSGTSTCADPDFSTHVSDEGTAQGAIQAALNAVDNDDDLIILCDGTYGFTSGIVQHNGTVGHDLITIEAEDAGDVTLDGNGDYQLLNFINTDVSITGVNFEDAYDGSSGAAIYVEDGSLEVIDATFTDNYADGGSGGAIFSAGSDVTVDGTTFTSNTTDGFGGGAIGMADYDHRHTTGWAGELTVSDSVFTDNDAYSVGGAIYSTGDTTVTDSEFTNNTTYNYWNDGGAIGIGDVVEADLTVTDSHFELNDVGDVGGAIYYCASGSATITGSLFDSNAADDEGGAIFAGCNDADLTVSSSQFTENQSNEYGGAISYGNYGAHDVSEGLTITSSEFRDNSAYYYDGGALYIADTSAGVMISDSVFTGNASDGGYGGAIGAYGDGPLDILDSEFAHNTAANHGGAIDVHQETTITRTRFSYNHADGEGGALGANGGSLTISSSTFSHNSSDWVGGAIWATDSGGVSIDKGTTFTTNSAVYAGGAIYASKALAISGSYFSSNTARVGGAIWLNNITEQNVATLRAITSTRFTSNRAGAAGGAVGYLMPKGGYVVPKSEVSAWQKKNKFSGNRGGRTPIFGGAFLLIPYGD